MEFHLLPGHLNHAFYEDGVSIHSLIRRFSKEEVGFQKNAVALLNERLYPAQQVNGFPEALSRLPLRHNFESDEYETGNTSIPGFLSGDLFDGDFNDSRFFKDLF